MADTDSSSSIAEEPEPVSLAEFLETVPPNRLTKVEKLVKKHPANPSSFVLTTPQIQLHCSSDACNGTRFFSSQPKWEDLKNTFSYHFFSYTCRNCGYRMKVYAIGARIINNPDGEAFKFGEAPPFGPPTPPRVIKLIGPDRDTFLMGRRAENQGLGIGAFAYYRRVVEDQVSRFLEEIIRVSEKIGAQEDMLLRLRAARDETQFSKVINGTRDVLPETLLIHGHNPLLLLHNALSKGLHAKTDEECLEIATSIRVVLTELADRLGSALKDEAELNAAVSRLMTPGFSKTDA